MSLGFDEFVEKNKHKLSIKCTKHIVRSLTDNKKGIAIVTITSAIVVFQAKLITRFASNLLGVRFRNRIEPLCISVAWAIGLDMN